MIAVLRALWPDMRRHRAGMLLVAFAMLGEVTTELLMPWPLKFVVDDVLFERHPGGARTLRTSLSGHALHGLVLISLAALAIAAFDALFSYLDMRGSEMVAQRAIYQLRRRLFAHLQRQSMSFHHHYETRVGDLLSRLSGDIQSLQDLAAGGFSNLITNSLVLALAVSVMLVLDWRLALVSVVLTVPLFVLTRKTTIRMKLALRDARRQEGRVSAVLAESLSSIKLIQAFGREKHEESRLEGASSQSLAANLEAALLQSRLNPYITVFSTLATVGVMAYAVLQVLSRAITPGEMLIFLGYQRGMQSPIRQLSKLSYSVGKASAGVERINETFARVPSVSDTPGAKPIKECFGGLVFQRVTFGYRPDDPVLREVSFEARPGQVIAVVGATGSGKSTLLSLLPRFYDPWEGRILLDGCDIRSLTAESLRAQISLVLQDSLIFRATIRENIAYGRPDATATEIEAAAAAAGVGRIVERLVDGYDTVLSERGTSLSGGEKQCIGIARAILKEAPIVVLDEPTSSMDAATEELVMEGVARLLEGRTGFIIAHRLTTIRRADLVIVLEDGRIIEQGAPRQLLEDDRLFASFARSQGLSASSL